MWYTNPDLMKRIVDDRLKENLREAETRHLLRKAGVGQHNRTFEVYRTLSGLGHLLVVLGQRLERFEMAPVTPPMEPCRAEGTSCAG